jgi:hypothetical protein
VGGRGGQGSDEKMIRVEEGRWGMRGRKSRNFRIEKISNMIVVVDEWRMNVKW